MVLCLIALPIFAFLGIFSIKFRKLALESLDCIFRNVTLRKCKSGLDDRIKSQVTGKALKISPKAAGFIYRNFRIISWVLLIVFLLSTYYGAVGIYNYWLYGNCNGPSETGFCMLDPTGENSKTSEVEIDRQLEVIYPSIESDDPIIGNPDANLTIIEFGCYQCPYTKKAEPIVKEVLSHYGGKVNLQFKTFTIPMHNLSYLASLGADCAKEQGKYIEYHDEIFVEQGNLSMQNLIVLSSKIGLDAAKFSSCLASGKYKNEVDSDTIQGIQAGVSGTPTFFINQRKIVGPKPFRSFKTVIDKELGD